MPTRTQTATILMAGMLTTMVAIVAGRMVFGLVMPAMLPALGLTYAHGSLLGAASALGYLVGITPAGTCASRCGEKRAVVLGLALSALAHGCLAAASAFTLLLALMFALGIGTAFTFTPLLGLLGDIFPERRGTVLSVAGSGIGLGMLAAGAWVPLVVTAAVDGWRLTWLVLSALSLITLVAVQAALPVRSTSAGGGHPVAAFTGYAAVWRHAALRNTALMYGALGVAFTANNLFNYSYAVESGLPPPLAGGLVAAAGIISIFAGPALGYLSDRMDRSLMLYGAFLISAAVTGLIVTLPVTPAFAVFFVVLGLITLGTPALVIAQATSQAQQARLPGALATSFVTFAYALGQLLAPIVIGVVSTGAEGFLRWVFLAESVLLALAVMPGLRARSAAAAQ